MKILNAENLTHHDTGAQVRHCHAFLYRAGRDCFTGQLKLEDGHQCRLKAVLHNANQLRINLWSLASLDWAHAILQPAAEPNFVGQLTLSDNRRYEIGVYILRGEYLHLEVYLRPLHLHANGLRFEVV
jgi:hypothetical protein